MQRSLPGDEDPPDHIPAAPLVFGHVLDEDHTDLELRLVDARHRWLRAVQALEPRGATTWRWPTVVVPPWVTTSVGVVLMAAGAWGIVAAPVPETSREGPPALVRVDHAGALRFANHATREELIAAGVYRAGVARILAERPFSSWEELDGTSGIGARTLAALRRGAEVRTGG